MNKRIYMLFVIFFILLSISAKVFAEKVKPEDKIKSSNSDRIIFFNTENGITSDCILIQSNGYNGLIDTANRKSSSIVDFDGETITFNASDRLNTEEYLSNGADLAEYMKSTLKIDHLDFIIITHAHSDHIGGLEEIVNSSLVDEHTKLFYKTYSHCISNIDDDLPEDTLMSFDENGNVMFFDSKTGEKKDSVQKVVYDQTQHWRNQAFLYAGIKAFAQEHGTMIDISSRVIVNGNEDKIQTKQPDLSKIQNDLILRNVEFDIGDTYNYYDDYISFDFGDFNIKLFNLYINTECELSKDNTNSIVTLITKGDMKIYSGGDVDVRDQTEQKIARKINELVGSVDVLKLNHHGNDYSNALETFDLLQPKYALYTWKYNSETSPEKRGKVYRYYAERRYGTEFFETALADDGIVVDFNTDKIMLYNLYSEENSEKLNSVEQCKGEVKYKSALLYNYKQCPTSFDANSLDCIYIDNEGNVVSKWKKIDDVWYYFDPDNYNLMKTGWIHYGANWYYCLPNRIYDGEEVIHQYGEMVKGRQYLEYNGEMGYYYFCQEKNEYQNRPEGAMVIDIEIDGHYYGEDGREVIEDTDYIDIMPYMINPIYYSDINPDIREAYGYDEKLLKEHYYKYGIKEGRKASPVFDVEYYKEKYADIINENDLTDNEQITNYFVETGIKEGQAGNYYFDAKFYLNNYEDLKSAYKNNYTKALKHFAEYGIDEGRQSSENFNVKEFKEGCSELIKKVYGDNYIFYYERAQGVNRSSYDSIDISEYMFDSELYYSLYPDLQVAFGKDEEKLRAHYINYGIKEGRIASFVFNIEYYINANEDVKAAFGNDYEAVYNHFIKYGIHEGRSASKYFNVIYYIENNSDVLNEYSENFSKALEQFVKYGINEGRITSEEFNVIVYRDQNEDLESAYGNYWKAYYKHHIMWGYNEGRTCV